MNVSIVNETPGMFAAENNNSFISFVGSVLNLTCSIASTPVANSEFRWKCSSGCLAGMESGQTISITVQQSEMIVCSYAVDSIEYDSDPVQIHVPVNGKLINLVATLVVFSSQIVRNAHTLVYLYNSMQLRMPHIQYMQQGIHKTGKSACMIV